MYAYVLCTVHSVIFILMSCVYATCVMYSSQCYVYINVLCVCYVLCTVHSVIFILISCVYVMCYVQFTVLYLY